MPVEVLQLTPLIKSGDDELHKSYQVCRWFDLPDRENWLDENGGSIRAVVTAGHLGITNEMRKRLPALGIVAIAGVGYERVDLEEARAHGIRVSNTPRILTDDVADFAIGLMIATMRRIPAADHHLRHGHWTSGEMPLTTKVSGRRYGIYGLGQIGQAVAQRLQGFGGTIAYTSTAPKDVSYAFHPTLLELAKASDILFLTAAASSATRNIVDRKIFDALGPSGVLVNVARGAIVHEQDLIAALEEGRLGAAGLDVYADEPNVPPALSALANTVLTPHVGSATVDAREAMAQLMLANLEAFFTGQPLPTPVL